MMALKGKLKARGIQGVLELEIGDSQGHFLKRILVSLFKKHKKYHTLGHYCVQDIESQTLGYGQEIARHITIQVKYKTCKEQNIGQHF